MSEAEMIEMMYQALGYSDRNFEFWLSASFAVVLVFHFASNRLTTMMYRLITLLYISSTVLFISRWLVAGIQYSFFRNQLLDMNANIWMTGNGVEAVITISYLVVILGGTIGTILFGRKSMQKVNTADN